MKCALIGSNPGAIGLLRQLTESGRFGTIPCCLSDGLLDAVTSGSIPVQRVAAAEDLLTGNQISTVIIALSDPDEILRLTRAAMQADLHVVVWPPSEQSSPALSFELHLVFDESQTCLIPVPGRWWIPSLPALQQSLGLRSDEVRQVALEVTVSDSSPASLRDAVRNGLDVLSATGFRYSQVTCLDSCAADGTLITRMITLSAQPTAEERLPTGTLTVRVVAPGQTEGHGILRVHAADGTIRTVDLSSPDFADRIAVLTGSRDACTELMQTFSQTLELCEAVEKSIRRRRTVDVHFESGSERSAFKSQMTAMGCGVLSWLLFGMVAYLIAAQLLDLPRWVWHIARILWMAPLMLFLVAQFLLPLARERAGKG